MTDFILKDGELYLFKQKSQAGNDYWTGSVMLNGTKYYVNLFDGEKQGKNGKLYRKGNVKIATVQPKKEGEPEQKEWQSESFDDEIPF